MDSTNNITEALEVLRGVPLAPRIDVQLVPVLDLLERLDITVTSRRSHHGGTELYALCPSPSHDDHSPSWSVLNAPGSDRHGLHSCHACSYRGGPETLVAGALGIRIAAARALLWSWYGDDTPDGILEATLHARLNSATTGVVSDVELPVGSEPLCPSNGRYWDYAMARGLTKQEVDRYQVRVVRRGKLAGRLLFPVFMKGRLVTWFARRVRSGKSRYGQLYAPGGGAAMSLYGWDDRGAEDGRTAVLVEDIFSALRVRRWLELSASSLVYSGDVFAVLGSSLGTYRARLLRRYSCIYVLSDPDAAGDKLYQETRERLGAARVVRRLRPLDGKDPDELSDIELSELFSHPDPLVQKPRLRYSYLRRT